MSGLVILCASIVKKKWVINSAFMALYAFTKAFSPKFRRTLCVEVCGGMIAVLFVGVEWKVDNICFSIVATV
jgi:short-subunit dehydrogenase